MDFSRLTQFTLIVTFAFALVSGDENELISIEQMARYEICGFIGGQCRTGSCSRELRHSWGIPLCHDSRICCAIPPSPHTASSVGGLSAASVNQCNSQRGVCIAWYNSCSGSVAQLDCDNAWESCCLPPSMQQTTENSDSAAASSQTAPSSMPTSTITNQEETNTGLGRGTLPSGQCGRQIRSPRQKRIVGGSLSLAGSWPWHVGISSALGYIHCAGTIINNTWILTAAHCFKGIGNPTLYRVVTGTHPEQTQIDYSINRIIKHSLYEEHSHIEIGHSHKYDIALVELQESITYTDSVQPACLPSTTEAFEGKTCWLTGWGSTRYNSTEDEFRLRHVRGQVLSRTQCESHWGDLVDGKMLCFGNKWRGGCTGDSGGGMFCEDDTGAYTVAGVISWGSAQCNQRSTVLTGIAQYHAWIQRTMAS